MSILNVAVDPTLSTAAQLVQSTSPLSAWLQFGAGTAFLILCPIFGMLLTDIYGRLKLPFRVVLTLLGMVSLGIAASGSYVIFVRSQAAGKLVLPSDPPLPIPLVSEPRKETVVDGKHDPRDTAHEKVTKTDDGTPADQGTVGPVEIKVTVVEPVPEPPIKVAAPPVASGPATFSIRYVLRDEAPRYPGSIRSAADLSDGLRQGMPLTLSGVTGKSQGAVVTVSGTYVVDSVDLGGGELGEYQTATLRKVSQK